mmetsp:Transcript_24697/g.78962  ORF Transcript_24697/g.78962 Transcript_24697/m.78962 type:complete len:391 (+) Transcript_24697:23-1195(+)
MRLPLAPSAHHTAAALVAAAIVTIPTSPATALDLAAPDVSGVASSFAARIQSNIQKGDFQERNARFQERLGDIQSTAAALKEMDAAALQQQTKEALSSSAAQYMPKVDAGSITGAARPVDVAAKATAAKEALAAAAERNLASLSTDYEAKAARTAEATAKLSAGVAETSAATSSTVRGNLGRSFDELRSDAAYTPARLSKAAAKAAEATESLASAPEAAREATAQLAETTASSAQAAAAKAAAVAARSAELAQDAAGRTAASVKAPDIDAPDVDVAGKAAAAKEALAAGERNLASLSADYDARASRTAAGVARIATAAATTAAAAPSVLPAVDASDLGEATSDAAAALGEAAKESAIAFAARVQDNVGKTDFAARNARLQERVAGALAQP